MVNTPLFNTHPIRGGFVVGGVALGLTLTGGGVLASVQTTADVAPPMMAEAQASPVDSQSRRGKDVRLKKVRQFDTPVYVTAPSADRKRVFVVEQGGKIQMVLGGKVQDRPFLNLSKRMGSANESGLLSVAFAPDYDTSRLLYVNYTDRAGDTAVVQFKAKKNRNVAKRGSSRSILNVKQPASNHNGGQLQFGADGYLYIGMGDGGGSGDPFGNGQDLTTLHGALLRIDPTTSGRQRYRIPATNPFAGSTAARPETYASGLRNPWRFSFDRRNGALLLSDVGQSKWEEVNFAQQGEANGANFGWPVFEGPDRFSGGSAPGHQAPQLAKSHADGNCSITGGYVVRDNKVQTLQGCYVYADFCKGDIRKVKLSSNGARKDRSTGLNVSRPSSFGEDARGRVYVTSLGSGGVYRLARR